MGIEDKTVLDALEQIRPYLQEDGGDVELVEVTTTGDVKIRLTGACSNCDMSEMTLKAGIENALRNSIPGIGRIEAVK